MSPSAGDVLYYEGNIVEFTAGVDLTKGQVCDITGDWTISPTDDFRDKAICVPLNNALSGEKVEALLLCTIVYLEIEAGKAVVAGDFVGPTITVGQEGKIVAIVVSDYTTPATYAQWTEYLYPIVGVAVEGGTGTVIAVALCQGAIFRQGTVM